MNERIIDDLEPFEDIPLAPINLAALTTESGIRLVWQMPQGYDPSTIIGYRILRKGTTNQNFMIIGETVGFDNMVFNDNNTGTGGASFSYYVISYNHTFVSNPSNIVNITAPPRPNPPSSFSAIHHGINTTELQWENSNQFFDQTRLYRAVFSANNPFPTYDLLATFNPNQSVWFDHSLTPGMKHLYKLNHYTQASNNESNSRFAFVQVPYRDMAQPSPVYIKRLAFTVEVQEIECWTRGKPEFRLSAFNASKPEHNPHPLMNPPKFIQFAKREKMSQVLTNIMVLEWYPGYFFDMITFHAFEEDGTANLDLDVTVKYQNRLTQSLCRSQAVLLMVRLQPK